MNFKKILASVAAAAVAVSTMALSIFADGSVELDGKNYWAMKDIINLDNGDTVEKFFGDIDPTKGFEITFTGSDKFCVMYNEINCTTADGGALKVESVDNKIVVDSSNFLIAADGDRNPWAAVAVSYDDGKKYSVSWTIEQTAAEEEAPAEEEAVEEEAPAEEEAAEEEAVEEEATEEEAVEEEATEEVADPNALPFTLGQYTYDFVFNGTDYENTKTITFTFETADDGDFGGGVMFNGTACGWSQSEDNFFSGPEGDKVLKCVKIADCKYELTVAIPEGIFGTYTDEDFYAQVVVQKWWGSDPISIVAVELDKVAATEEAPAEEAPATGDVDGATDSTKGSPDTGVADVAVVAGLALVAGGAFIVAKKRK